MLIINITLNSLDEYVTYFEFCSNLFELYSFVLFNDRVINGAGRNRQYSQINAMFLGIS